MMNNSFIPDDDQEDLTSQILRGLKEYQNNSTEEVRAKLDELNMRLVASNRQKELLDDGLEELLAKLEHPDWQVRMRAVRRLGEKADPRTLEALIKTLSDAAVGVRYQAVTAVANYRKVEVVVPILSLLEDPDLNTRFVTQNALKQLGSLAVPALIKTLESESTYQRWTAASILGDLRDKKALEALNHLAQTDQSVDPTYGAIKDVAARAIRSIQRDQLLDSFEEDGTNTPVKIVGEKGEPFFDWNLLLKKWSIALLSSNDLSEEPDQEAIAKKWLGQPGTSEEELVQLETRIGTSLPPSYRAFLKTSNGWGQITNFIYKLWSTDEVEWFAVRNQEWIDAWNSDPYPISDAEYFVYGENQNGSNMRSEYLQTVLEISDVGDAAIYLLNPEVVTPEGEWEAWFFANWIPGANRYPSFWEMMQAEYINFLRLHES